VVSLSEELNRIYLGDVEDPNNSSEHYFIPSSCLMITESQDVFNFKIESQDSVYVPVHDHVYC
jgi:hypothetical protein